MKFNKFLLMLLAASMLVPAASATAIFSIEPITLNPSAGSNNDILEVLLTNTGPSSISVAGFAFGVTSNNAGITFVSANMSTTTDPYIFAGNSFDAANSLPLNTSSGASLGGSDLTNDGSGVTVSSGESFALGRVFYDVSGTANPGPANLTFTTSADSNGLTDPDFDAIPIGSLEGAQVDIQAAPVPEPSALLLIPAGLLLLRFRKRSE